MTSYMGNHVRSLLKNERGVGILLQLLYKARIVLAYQWDNILCSRSKTVGYCKECRYQNEKKSLHRQFLLINNYVKGNNNKTLIKGRIFNDKNANTLVTVNGTIDENTIGNDYTEDIRGLNIYSNNLEIKPNLIVSTNEVIANHMVTIGNFDEKQVEYLKEKGISNENIQFLLLDAFLNNIFPKDMF